MTVNSGPVEIKGSQLVQTAATSGSTVYGVTGNIASAVYHDLTPSDDETEIYYTAGDSFGNDSLMAISPADGTKRFIANLPLTPIQMHIDPSGTYIYIVLSDKAVSKLYRYPTAGGARMLIHPNCFSFGITPSGNKIVFKKYTTADGIWKMNPDGTGATQVVPSNKYINIWGCPTDTTVRADSNTNPVDVADFDLQTGFQSTTLSNAQVFACAISTSGTVQWGLATDGAPRLFRSLGRGISAEECSIYASPDYAAYPVDICPSPSGTQAVVATDMAGYQARITDGTSNTILFEEQRISRVAWGPHIDNPQLVGSGLFAGGAGAILFSEAGDRLPALVVADATTRSSCKLTSISAKGDLNTVFRLDCDSLTKLYYTKNSLFTLIPVVTAAGGIKGAFISFVAETGRVASVVTFTGTPNVVAVPGGVEITGELNQVVGPKGKGLGLLCKVKL